MTHALSLSIALWIWIIIAAAALGSAIGMLVVFADDDEWRAIGLFFVLWICALGPLALGLNSLGWPSVALILWRILAIAGVLLVPITLFFAVMLKRRSHASGPPGARPDYASLNLSKASISIIALGGLVMIGDAVLAFTIQALPSAASPIAAAEIPDVPTASPLDVMAIVWVITLSVLGLGAVAFLFLFARNLRFGGAPQMETHWGGVGGGLGGWRMSAALSYLLVAGALLLLFSVFLMRFDRRQNADKAEEKAPARSAATATPAASATPKPTSTPAPKASPSPESKETNPSPSP